jgi:hypothetical protein
MTATAYFDAVKETEVHSMYRLSLPTTREHLVLTYSEVQDPKSLGPVDESTYRSRAIKAKGH